MATKDGKDLFNQ